MTKGEAILIEKGIRPTAMRLLIYKFLAKQKTAIALTDIENSYTKSDRTTLYRSIKTFEEKGVVHQIDDGTGIAKYALFDDKIGNKTDRDLHLHFHCNTCNKTTCLTDYKIPHISLPQGYQTEDVNLVVKGICEKCH